MTPPSFNPFHFTKDADGNITAIVADYLILTTTKIDYVAFLGA